MALFEFVGNLLKLREFRMDEGKLTLLKQPIVILSARNIVALQKDLERQGLINVIYRQTRDASREWVRCIPSQRS